MPVLNPVKLTLDEWRAEAERRYGPLGRDIRFTCPACGHVQTGQDFLDAGMSPKEAGTRAGFSCIGRWAGGKRDAFDRSGPGPCNYAGGGLLQIAPVHVEYDGGILYVFDFADEPLTARKEEPCPA